jgi:NADH-quinone oxidoreductase subunit H
MQGSALAWWNKAVIVGAVALVVLVALVLWPARKPAPKPGELPPQEGGFPVPPMDLKVPPSPRLKRIEAQREPVSVGADSSEESS